MPVYLEVTAHYLDGAEDMLIYESMDGWTKAQLEVVLDDASKVMEVPKDRLTHELIDDPDGMI